MELNLIEQLQNQNSITSWFAVFAIATGFACLAGWITIKVMRIFSSAVEEPAEEPEEEVEEIPEEAGEAEWEEAGEEEECEDAGEYDAEAEEATEKPKFPEPVEATPKAKAMPAATTPPRSISSIRAKVLKRAAG